MRASVRAEASHRGMWNFLIRSPVRNLTTGLPIKDMTTATAMYSRIVLKYQPRNTMMAVTAVMMMYLASLSIKIRLGSTNIKKHRKSAVFIFGKGWIYSAASSFG